MQKKAVCLREWWEVLLQNAVCLFCFDPHSMPWVVDQTFQNMKLSLCLLWLLQAMTRSPFLPWQLGIQYENITAYLLFASHTLQPVVAAGHCGSWYSKMEFLRNLSVCLCATLRNSSLVLMPHLHLNVCQCFTRLWNSLEWRSESNARSVNNVVTPQWNTQVASTLGLSLGWTTNKAR